VRRFTYTAVYDHGIMIPDNVDADTDETLSLYIAIVLSIRQYVSPRRGGTRENENKSLMKVSMLYSLVVVS
jgi:hypothetical protein